MKVLYFAWLRAKVGMGQEDVVPPDTVRDVASLLDWLKDRSPKHAEALANPAVVKVAVNQEYAAPDTAVKAGDEVALFPPVTGG
ncbi:MAG TPA: molybdopterin converting factor subunit 1 [Azospirillaceae bacterium]|nr:molybdopterin converting factor subunit 1 [Azospirillaceae bacterium]